MDWGYTESDKDKFNMRDKEELDISFAEGQLFMTVYRPDDYKIGVYLTYSDPIFGRELMESLRPKNASNSDF